MSIFKRVLSVGSGKLAQELDKKVELINNLESEVEKYSDEDTQSYVKFPTKDKWIDGFLKKTIENCYRGLKQNKYMLINIANTPKYKFIEEETIRISKEFGFKQEKTVELTLSSVMGAGHKYEPIFVFKKC